MKKTILIIAALTIIVISAKSQDSRVGIRFIPLNSQYLTNELLSQNPVGHSDDYYTRRFDSISIGIFGEKYFEKQGFLLRADMNFGNLKTQITENDISVSGNQSQKFEHSESYTQKYFNINLGIGTHVNWSKLTFTFGGYIPLTILPKGKIENMESNYINDVQTQYFYGTGTYKPTLGFGIGVFGGISTTILKHLSIGLEVAYQIEYLSREVTWHNEMNYYGTNPATHYVDETTRVRNYYTSKVKPSIVVAYAFGYKK